MLLRDNPAYDKLFKVRPLLDRLANTFRKEYRPSKFVSIDEGMVKYKDLASNSTCPRSP